MNLKGFLRTFVSISLLTAQIATAKDVKVIGLYPQVLLITHFPSLNVFKKQIQLLRIEMSGEEKGYLKQQVTLFLKKPNLTEEHPTLPARAELGMNKVPVLDQGIHGTCVTFAVTGALDAIIAKGDYVSQLCNLQLGKYLESRGSGYSGWEGSNAIDVINQISQYGIMNKANQKSLGCGGLTRYPLFSRNTGNEMEPEQFGKKSELIFGKWVNWSEAYRRRESLNNLAAVKEAILAGC
ncbi:MAG: hypothetical protein H0U57_12970 [Tatlockia sp.]|nr:hypothetical protein [Tatlockia sp.]